MFVVAREVNGLERAHRQQKRKTSGDAVNSIYFDVIGEVLLDNERVLVQRVVVPAGKSTGGPVHSGNQLQVFIKGGVLRSLSSGRATLWKTGRVKWHDVPEASARGWTNIGETPIEMVWVGLKPRAAPAFRAGAVEEFANYGYLDYPLIPGEDLLENGLVIVQRFLVKPGQWEGVHAHHPNMLYIHIKGGQWSARSYKEPEHAYDHPSVDGEVGWMPTIDISEGHESGNVGDEPIDLVWVSLKG
jgi:hypothetical protein